MAGEQSGDVGDTNKGEIYDPVSDTWTPIPSPPGWSHVGDAPCCVLPDGRLLLGSIDDKRTAIYDPISKGASWTPAANKDDRSSEETWTLLPDNAILVAECTDHPKLRGILSIVTVGLVP